MNSIVAEIIKEIKHSKDAITREEKIWHKIEGILTQYVGKAFEAIDKELAETYRQKGYHVERQDSRTIQGIFGAVTFRRRYMKKDENKGIYPLDHELGLQPRKRYTPYLQYCIAQIASKNVYRSTALAVNLLTPVTISHQEIGTIIKNVGQQYNKWEKEQIDVEPAADTVLKKPEVLYIEGDGVIIKGQGKKKRELHRFQIAEGVKVKGKRRELEEAHYFASFSHNEATMQVEKYLESHYDLSETTVLSNSDGGAGYSKETFNEIIGYCKQHEHFRDRYHVNTKIKERLNFVNKGLVNKLQYSLWEYNWDKVNTIIDTAESLADNDIQEGQVILLKNYLIRNREYLRPIEQREGLEKYKKGLGTCESNHRIYTYRMKKQGRRWGKYGGEAMLKIITGLKNKDLSMALIKQDNNFNKKQSRRFNGAVRMALKTGRFIEHEGVLHGGIVNFSPSSSAMGHLAKIFA